MSVISEQLHITIDSNIYPCGKFGYCKLQFVLHLLDRVDLHSKGGWQFVLCVIFLLHRMFSSKVTNCHIFPIHSQLDIKLEKEPKVIEIGKYLL